MSSQLSSGYGNEWLHYSRQCSLHGLQAKGTGHSLWLALIQWWRGAQLLYSGTAAACRHRYPWSP